MADNELFGISEQLNDTISRAAVVDEIDGVDWYHINKNGEMVHGANDAEHQAWYKADDIYAAIERVPSAQPVAKDINVPVNDCISRQAAIDALADYIHNVDRVYSTGKLTHEDCMDAAHSVLDELPSAQRWISCKTALPKTEEKVWVTCEHLDIYGKPHRYVCKAYHVDRYTMRSDVGWWDEGCDEYREEDDQFYVLEGWYECIHNWGDYSSVRITEDKVVAWCPLPEPYKEHPDADHD